jgi:hypothetical protein
MAAAFAQTAIQAWAEPVSVLNCLWPRRYSVGAPRRSVGPARLPQFDSFAPAIRSEEHGIWLGFQKFSVAELDSDEWVSLPVGNVGFRPKDERPEDFLWILTLVSPVWRNAST